MSMKAVHVVWTAKKVFHYDVRKRRLLSSLDGSIHQNPYNKAKRDGLDALKNMVSYSPVHSLIHQVASSLVQRSASRVNLENAFQRRKEDALRLWSLLVSTHWPIVRKRDTHPKHPMPRRYEEVREHVDERPEAPACRNYPLEPPFDRLTRLLQRVTSQ